jgi:hypothetical protein
MVLTCREVEALIDGERRYQDAKWGPVAEHGHEPGEWLEIMDGIFTKACAALDAGVEARFMSEIRQLGAVAAAACEQYYGSRPSGGGAPMHTMAQICERIQRRLDYAKLSAPRERMLTMGNVLSQCREAIQTFGCPPREEG